LNPFLKLQFSRNFRDFWRRFYCGYERASVL